MPGYAGYDIHPRANMSAEVNEMAMTVKNFQISQIELLKKLQDFRGGKSVTVGIHEDAGQHADDGISNAQLGALLNYGNPHNTLFGKPAPIPARPWLIPGVESGTNDIIDVITEAVEGGATLDDTMNQIGAFAAGAAQQYMTDLKTPPNSAYTIEQKGSSNPLIQHGDLRASVTWKVTDEKPEEGLK